MSVPVRLRWRLSMFGWLLVAFSLLMASPVLSRDGDVAPLGARDGRVSVADALVTLRYALGLITPIPDDDLYHADVAPLSNGVPNPDGRLSVADALVILRVALNLVTLPPAGPPTVAIKTPSSLITVGATPMSISGDVGGDVQSLTVNGVAITPTGGTFQAQVDLNEGLNTIVVRAVSSTGEAVTSSIAVSLDLTPPYVTIDSHVDGETVYSDTITVTGLINDIVRGTIEDAQANVTVNGVPATVANRSYALPGVALNEGDNLITVQASDQVGNTGSLSITVKRVIPTGRRLELVSGDGQSATIGTVLPNPLQVRVLNDIGQPVSGASVVFRVSQGSGVVGAGTAAEGRGVVVETDAAGEAQTGFKVGVRAGTANQKVTANVVGYEDQVVFVASASGNIGNKVNVNSGNNQRGAVNLVLPAPLVVSVTDEGANVVSGARVQFDVVSGGGKFLSNDASSMVVQTDSDGRASAQFVLGSLEGVDAQRVLVTLIDAPAGDPITAGFSATGFVPADPGLTSISGVVLDNQDVPIPGVTLRIEDSTRLAVTDAAGQFEITEAPVGPVHLIADGSTATVEGEFPSLSYNLVTIAGVENPLPGPIYMVKLNTDNSVYAGPADVSLTLDKYPGFRLDIAKDSVTFPDGSRQGLVSVTSVNADTVPMPPPNGMQPQFIVTIQPTNTRFDPPARLTLPNFDGHAPGAQAEMYSYDHDLEEFVTIGLGTVSEDGTTITSNPGVGVIKAGWHCGSQPGGQGCTHSCGECEKCAENCTCANDPAKANTALKNQTKGDCQKVTCSGTQEDLSDRPTSCKKCVAGGGVQNEPDGQPTHDKCVVCMNGEEQKIELAAPTETNITLSLPGPIRDEINEALEELKKIGVIASLTTQEIQGKKKFEECCDPEKGKGEKEEASLTGTLAGIAIDVKVWPPGPIPQFESPEFYVGVGWLKAEAEFIGGIFVGLDAKQSGTVGYKKDTCSKDANDNAGCFFGTLGIDIEPKASVRLGGSGALKFTWLFDDDPAATIALALEAKGEGKAKLTVGSVTYNAGSCSEGLKGGVVTFNGLTFDVTVQVKGTVNSYSIDRTWNFLSCTTNPTFGCRQNIF